VIGIIFCIQTWLNVINKFIHSTCNVQLSVNDVKIIATFRSVYHTLEALLSRKYVNIKLINTSFL